MTLRVLENTGAYLLQNQLNPFPISGVLKLDDAGHLTFTLDEKAAEANLGWLEKELGTTGLKERIKAGERPVAFDVAVSGLKVGWPLSLGRTGMKFEAGDRNWVVSLVYPSGGAVLQTINMFEAGKHNKPWKAALAAAGAV